MKIAILNLPWNLASAVHGMQDILTIANLQAGETLFTLTLISDLDNAEPCPDTLLLIPPGRADHFPEYQNTALLDFAQRWHQQGGMIGACCASVFVLAAAGILDGLSYTTHWQLGDRIRQEFPALGRAQLHQVWVDEDKVLTAAGLYAFQDLLLHLIARFAGVDVARQVADFCLLDFSGRQQSYYQRFLPSFTHGDELVLKAQRYLTEQLTHSPSVTELAQYCGTSERNLSRRFTKVLAMSPSQYQLALKMDKAKTRLPHASVDQVAFELGYQDTSNFSKAFKRIVGVAPGDFRTRLTME
uniref:GlxA family transcriptional regulator n=1 Tax=Thaumasiovibrio occultus TaxID=1891184 RepID=UPI000B34FA49|nr:helix-turn-helix domain-containing protein [Thaumasiovibrio occultus]